MPLYFLQQMKSHIINQVVGDLPSSRLRLHKSPFSQADIDYFGPLSVKLKGLKLHSTGAYSLV